MEIRKPTPEEIEISNRWSEWSRSPSEFSWYYDEPETFIVVSGKAEIIDQRGKSRLIEKGDWVHFDQGEHCTWNIMDCIVKRYKFG